MKTVPVRRVIAALTAAIAMGGLTSMGQAARAVAASVPLSAPGSPIALNPVPPAASTTGARVGVALGRATSRGVRDIEREDGDTGPAVQQPLAPRHGPRDPGPHTLTGGGQRAA